MNDCIHALHRRLDRYLISDIANQNFYALPMTPSSEDYLN